MARRDRNHMLCITRPVSCQNTGHVAPWTDSAPIPIFPWREHINVAVSSTTLVILGGIIPNGTSSSVIHTLYWTKSCREWMRYERRPARGGSVVAGIGNSLVPVLNLDFEIPIFVSGSVCCRFNLCSGVQGVLM